MDCSRGLYKLRMDTDMHHHVTAKRGRHRSCLTSMTFTLVILTSCIYGYHAAPSQALNHTGLTMVPPPLEPAGLTTVPPPLEPALVGDDVTLVPSLMPPPPAPTLDKAKANATIKEMILGKQLYIIPSNNNVSMPACRVIPTEPVYTKIRDTLQIAKLIKYTLSVRNSTKNPLEFGNTWTYKSNMWSRVVSGHGQTILNLAFNYGVLSLLTLNFGVVEIEIELEENVVGCLSNMTEAEKIDVVMYTAIRDFRLDDEVPVGDPLDERGSVCHQVILDKGGYAVFSDRCCLFARDSTGAECFLGEPNQWLRALDRLLMLLTVGVFMFGPSFVPNWLYSATFEKMQYVVKLKEPLYKTIAICRKDRADDVEADNTLDLRDRKDYIMCRRILSELPEDAVIPIKVSQFDINVNYRKLLPENQVPVSMTECISRALFLCKLRDLEPFAECCEANLFGCFPAKPKKWIDVCNLFGRILLVVLLPFPFYIRLAVYFVVEDPEIQDRYDISNELGLPMAWNYRLLQYLTPTHPVYLVCYVLYLSAGFMLAWLSGKDQKTRYQQAIIDSFSDLRNLSNLSALGMVIKNFLWPFKRFGVWGCFVGMVYWPWIMPVSLVICVVYCIPVVFLTCRIFLYTFKEDEDEKKTQLSKAVKQFEADRLLKKKTLTPKNDCCYFSVDCRRICLDALASIYCLMTIYTIMFITAEVVGFAAEVLCFTMMGLIVNASKVLKYGTLIFLVVIYSYDTYNNVNKKYLKLNKALFSEIKGRLGKAIDNVTSLPSWLQENVGFKACEASEQADYESSDNLCKENPYYWDINDLILFIDNEDNPRIPRKLFDDVCAIQVAGSPGPVYRSLLQATGKFLTIILFIVFVFIVVLSFGEAYKVSGTNTMLATLAGGFMPFIFRHVLKPVSSEVETHLVSFRSKLEEIIKNFCQAWPMNDFQFTVEEEPREDEEEGSTAGDGGKEGGGKDKAPNPDVSPTKEQQEQSKWLKMKKALEEVKIKAETMDLEPAWGRKVDILIYVNESDHEWLMEWSSVTELESELKENGAALMGDSKV